MFTAALFTIARTWKQYRCPLTYEWIKKLWYIYTMEYYSAIKNAFESVLMRWINLEPILQSEVSQKKKNNWAFLVAQLVKNRSTMQETWVRSLGWEEPLEKEMANHSSTLAGRFHGWRSMVGYSPSGCSESYTTERLHFHFSLYPAMEEFGILTVQQTISLITLLTDYIFLFQLLIQDCKS